MKKWLSGILILLVVAFCACALAEDAVPTLTFTEQERLNRKPIINACRPELTVDTWLQMMAVNDEDYFWSVDPAGPVFSFRQTDGDHVDAHIDADNVLRMDSVLNKPAKVTFLLRAEWAGQVAETNMYIEFFECVMPKTIGFDSEYTLYTGDTLRLDTNYDDGKWPYRSWLGLYPQGVGDSGVVEAWAESYPAGNGAATYIYAKAAGKTTVDLQANQDGLDWNTTITITVKNVTDSQGNKYMVDSASKTAYLSKCAKNIANATVPDTIKVGKKTFKVTGIGYKAFSKNKKLTSLTIGKNVEWIGAEAFYQCKKLQSITVKTKKLRSGSVGENAFKGIYSKAKFKCPSKKLAASYKKIFLAAGAPKKITCTK